MYYRETSICISCIILCYYDILIFYISVILYLFTGGYKCRLTIFPTGLIMLSLFCDTDIVIALLQCIIVVP